MGGGGRGSLFTSKTFSATERSKYMTRIEKVNMFMHTLWGVLQQYVHNF